MAPCVITGVFCYYGCVSQSSGRKAETECSKYFKWRGFNLGMGKLKARKWCDEATQKRISAGFSWCPLGLGEGTGRVQGQLWAWRGAAGAGTQTTEGETQFMLGPLKEAWTPFREGLWCPMAGA